MTETAEAAPAPKPPRKSTMPQVNRITVSDLKESLSEGLSDFARAPLFGLFFGGFYAVGGMAILSCILLLDMAYLAYPALLGFALVGPFVAVGLYEVSRRLEQGTPLKWGEVLGVVLAQRKRELAWMAFVMLFVFIMWMYQVRILLALFLGFQSFSTFGEFMGTLLTTQEGLTFLAVGHIVGAVVSLVLFSLTVVSCPLLLEREVDFVTAMITSVKTVATSPLAMLGWGVFVVLAVLFSALPLFLGLVFVLPILGHATWHLYRRAVTPLDGAPAE